MLVDSYNQEFGYELLSAVPHAWMLHLEGKLTQTRSGIGSEPLYYFSPKHTINKEQRGWSNTLKARREKILPYTNIHVPERPALKFPPYKEVYKNDIYKWEKPTLVIANRYNKEWNQPPINFFDPQILEWLFENLKKDYEIVYIAVDLPAHIEDENHSIDLPDRAIAARHGVKVFQDIKGKCWNTSLLQVFSNCEHYITMNGGYSILASLFGGTNLVYTTTRGNWGCQELKNNSFTRCYPNHANQRVMLSRNYEELKKNVSAVYVEKKPLINIIVRTSFRPNAFRNCMNSIFNQDYVNKNVIVTTDEETGVKYSRGYDIRHIDVSKVIERMAKPEGEEYGVYFRSNSYLKYVLQHVNSGYVMYLDDDDAFTNTNSLSTIMDLVDENTLLLWRVDINGKLIPSDSTFGKEIKVCDLSSIGMCHHSKHNRLTDWSPFKRADYRTARNIAKATKVVWLDKVLTRTQGPAGFGKKMDIMEIKEGWMKTVKVLDPSCGKVGHVKRLAKPIADELVKQGLVEYLNKPVGMDNAPIVVTKENIVTENKMVNPVNENKNAVKGSKRNSTGRKAGVGSRKKLSKGND